MFLQKNKPCKSHLIYLFSTIILLTTLACQKSNDSFITHDERLWLDKNDDQIEVLFGYQDPPNAFLDENGDYIGLLVDYQKEIENSLNHQFKFKHFDSWEDLITYSQTAQNYIIIGCARTNKREEYLSFTDAIVKIPYLVYTQRNSTISSMESLEDKNVCTVSKYAVNDYLHHHYPNIKPISFNNDLECIRAVSTGICDAMIINQMAASHIINSQAISNLKISNESGYMNRLAIAISKKDPTLFKIIDKTIDNIPTGRKKELYKKWVHASSNKFSKKTWLTILSILSILIGILVIMWLWLVSLKKQVTKQTNLIKENETKYTSLVEGSNDAIFLAYNRQFEITNKRFRELMGYSSKELENINFNKLVAPECLELINSRFQEPDKSKLPPKFEFTSITKSGKRILAEVSTSHIPYKDGIATQAVVRDISQVKAYEAELIRAKEDAEESDRLKSAFLATMSHELRTPLNAVIGFSDLIQKDLPLGDILHFSEIISMSGKHLLGLIEDVFDISLIETGDLKIEEEPHCIKSLLNEVHEIIKNEQIIQNKEHLDLILDNALENTETILFSDQRRIKQILINLLKNALKFTNSGSIIFGCDLHKENQQSFIKFFVKDSGIGIPEESQNLIFEVFRQADDSHTRIYGGTGLGLTICKKLAKFMGGDIWVQSEEGQGALFNFTIPFTKQSIKNSESLNIETTFNFENKTVLIAEDDQACFTFLETLLTPKGMTCIHAVNGVEAVKCCHDNDKIDLLLMDIDMPTMNGYLAAEKIKTLRPNIPIIAQTAFAVEGDEEKILAAGCDYYVSKLINTNDLFEKISLCIQ